MTDRASVDPVRTGKPRWDAEPIAELTLDPRAATVYEHGWQSWSPTGAYRPDVTSPRPARECWQTKAFRPEKPAPDEGFQGEVLLAVQPEPDAPVTVWAAPDPHAEAASIRARMRDGLAVSSDPLDQLDEAGLAWTRELLVDPSDRAPRWHEDPDDALAGRLDGEA